MIKKVEYECLICGDHIKSDSLKSLMCYECGNGIYTPVTNLLLNQ